MVKIRRSFVANSSSSSFLVGFPKKPTTVAEMETALFPHKGLLPPLWDGSPSYTTIKVAQQVLGDISDQAPATSVQAQELIRGGWFGAEIERQLDAEFPHWGPGAPETPEERRRQWHLLAERRDVIAGELYDKLMASHPLFSWYVVSYSDNDGDWHSFMEHGDNFANIPHFHSSRH